VAADKSFSDVTDFAQELRDLRIQRRNRVHSGRATRARRRPLTSAERNEVLQKTAGRCHICGGEIKDNAWEADHVIAHSTGGIHWVHNYLPAHSTCNNYRWNYDTEEFQWILKLGVWIRTEIANEKRDALAVGQRFCDHHRNRAARRKRMKKE
jgi:5-methylcytosine-specific restriction endonuclease McrA